MCIFLLRLSREDSGEVLFCPYPCVLHVALLAVGVDDADGLKERVDDGGAHVFHAAAPQVGRDGIRERRGGTQVVGLAYLAAAGEGPDVAVEGAFLPHDVEKGARIADGGSDLALVAYYPTVGPEAPDVRLREGRDLLRPEAREGLPEVGALIEHAFPRQSRLKALENK